LIVNIYMRTAVSRTKKEKNRSNLSAIFSAPRAAGAAIFSRLVILERVYRVSKNFPYYSFRFLIMIPFLKKIFLIFSKILHFFENIFVPFRRTVQYTQHVKTFFHITTSGLKPRFLELKYSNRKNRPSLTLNYKKIEHDDP